MFMSESAAKLLAPYAGPWKEPQVRHFLNRTGFSATTAEVETALQEPLAALVRRRVHYESAGDSYPRPDWATAPTAAQIAEMRKADASAQEEMRKMKQAGEKDRKTLAHLGD